MAMLWDSSFNSHNNKGINTNHGTVINSNIDTVPSIQSIPPKPIFIFGLPSSTPPEVLNETYARLDRQLDDYHVLVLRNTHEEYTAKLYAVDGVTTHDLDDIKKYIKSKL